MINPQALSHYIQIRCSYADVARSDEIAEKLGVSRSGLIRMALRDWLTQRESNQSNLAA